MTHRRALALPLALSLGLVLAAPGCGLLTDVTLGAGTLPAYEVDRAWELGAVDLGACPAGRHQVLDERTNRLHTLDVAPVPGGCGLTFLEPDAVLFDEGDSRRTAEALDGRRIEAVQSAAVEISGFRLTDGAGVPVDVGTVSSLRLRLADGVVLDDAGLARLQAGETVRSGLSDSLLDRIVEGVNEGEAVRADVEVSLQVPTGSLAKLPRQLRLGLHLQPVVTVDVLELIGG